MLETQRLAPEDQRLKHLHQDFRDPVKKVLAGKISR
jgi:hypothetical protein